MNKLCYTILRLHLSFVSSSFLLVAFSVQRTLISVLCMRELNCLFYHLCCMCFSSFVTQQPVKSFILDNDCLGKFLSGCDDPCKWPGILGYPWFISKHKSKHCLDPHIHNIQTWTHLLNCKSIITLLLLIRN